ncbi:MAG: hypothetical protein ACUVUQ_03855 [Thermodesulfovibrionales bacterium]
MSAFKDEMREDRKRMNREWGTIAKKMVTLVEDIISPATRPVIKRYFGCDPVYKSDNLLKIKDNMEYEIDVLVACEEKVFLIEVKSTPHVSHIDESLEKSKVFLEFFPEYKNKDIVLILGSLVFPENVIT